MQLEEMENLLDRLGIEYVGNRGDEIQGFCPAHEARTGHADRNPSWYINAETGMHICFSCQFKGGVVGLISLIKGIEYDESKKWLNEGGELSVALEVAVTKKEVFEELLHISEATLAAFTAPPAERLRSRGLSESAASKHEILWDRNRSNWIIPIRDEDGLLMGWQEKGADSRFFKNAPTGVQKSKTLFGLDKYTDGDMILVESPLDVVRLESVGVTGGVAAYGAYVSEEQISLLMHKANGRIIIAMDNDQAGMSAASNILTKLLEAGQEAWFFEYGDTGVKDIGGMSKSEILEGLAQAKHSVRYPLWV